MLCFLKRLSFPGTDSSPVPGSTAARRAALRAQADRSGAAPAHGHPASSRRPGAEPAGPRLADRYGADISTARSAVERTYPYLPRER